MVCRRVWCIGRRWRFGWMVGGGFRGGGLVTMDSDGRRVVVVSLDRGGGVVVGGASDRWR